MMMIVVEERDDVNAQIQSGYEILTVLTIAIAECKVYGMLVAIREKEMVEAARFKSYLLNLPKLADRKM
jgi:hypothetical protein